MGILCWDKKKLLRLFYQSNLLFYKWLLLDVRDNNHQQEKGTEVLCLLKMHQIKWKMPPIHFGFLQLLLWRGDKYFVDMINRLALGDFYIEYNEGGSLVTTSDEIFDAIRTGSLWYGNGLAGVTGEGRDTLLLGLLLPHQWYSPQVIAWYGTGRLEVLNLFKKLYDEYNIVWYPQQRYITRIRSAYKCTD